MVEPALIVLAAIVALGLAFDFVNGFHDTANAIATSVATRVLSPGQAVSMAAILNVIGAVSGTAVATTVGRGIVPPAVATQQLVAAALIAAISWNLLTWWLAIPSSSSHALIFSIVGAGIAAAGVESIQIGGITKTLQGLVFSPLLGFLVALLLLMALLWIFARSRPLRVTRIFGRLQIVSAAYMAFSHGSNDAQKTMGVLTMALASYYGWTGDEWGVPLWVILSAAAAMGLGTAMGGWRIVRTMGLKVVELRPIDGFAAETAAATVIEAASRLGIPVSTTHVISSSILGVGATRSLSAVRWGVAGRIVSTWVITIPACIALAWIVYSLLHLITGLP
ncbi:MAG TPA: inorganic phosphate transporter [Thermomicrobiales bacterium]|nr:inorganic phosphate transporter [Thermomicrobiales bacterium]